MNINDEISEILRGMSAEEALRFVVDEIRPRVSSLYQASVLLRDETEQLSAEDIAGLYKGLVMNSDRLNKTIDALVQFMVQRRREQSEEKQQSGKRGQGG